MSEEFAPAPAEESPVVETPAVDAAPEAPPSRMESFEKAFKTVSEDEAPGSAQREALGLKGAPEPSTAAKPDENGVMRTPDGKFAGKEGDEGAEKAADGEGADPEAKGAEKETATTGAPGRFSADAKAEWDKTPIAVRGEIDRAIRELESGLQQKDQELAPLRPYFEMASKSGVNLPDALGNYVKMEQALRQDLRGGLTAIAQNYGMTFEDMIAQASGSESASTDKDREILGLRQELESIKQQVGGISQTFEQQRESAVMTQIEQFAQAHPRFDVLQDEMTKMIETGYASGLEDAYAKADRLNPEMPQPQIAATPPPVQTREVRSVTGAPTAGSDPGYRRPSNSRTEALQRAFSASGF